MKAMNRLPPTEDAFGAAMLAAAKGDFHHPVVIERDDGFVDAHSAAVYVSNPKEWQSSLNKLFDMSGAL